MTTRTMPRIPTPGRGRRPGVTGLPPVTFPEACPWPGAWVPDADFWPEG
jgi:hypothetical protein